MLHIALLTTSFPAAGDGSEAAGSFVLDFATELAMHCNVTVLAPGHAGDSAMLSPTLKILRYSARKQPLSLLKVHNPLHWPALVDTLVSGRRILAQLASAQHLDHVFALWVLPCGYWAWRQQKQTGTPYSTWALGSDIWSLGRIPLIRTILRAVLRHSKTNFADGHMLQDEVALLGQRPCKFLPSTRRLEIPPAAPPTTRPPGRRLAFLGRWHPNKGPDLLLDALALLDQEQLGKIAEIRFYGGGPLEQAVLEQARELQAKGLRLTIGGYLGKTEAAALLQWGDYVLIPSRIESIPVIFSDAMKLSRPIVATPVGDLARLVGSYHCGIVAEAATAPAFARALSIALDTDPGVFSAGVAEAGQDFSLPASVARFLAAIE